MKKLFFILIALLLIGCGTSIPVEYTNYYKYSYDGNHNEFVRLTKTTENELFFTLIATGKESGDDYALISDFGKLINPNNNIYQIDGRQKTITITENSISSPIFMASYMGDSYSLISESEINKNILTTSVNSFKETSSYNETDELTKVILSLPF